MSTGRRLTRGPSPKELVRRLHKRLLRQSQIPDWSGDEAATHRDAAGGLAEHAAWPRRRHPGSDR